MNWKDAAQSFESSLMILRKDKNGWVIGFSVHPDEAPSALLDARLGTRFQIVTFEIGDDEQPVVPQEVRSGKKAVAIAGEMCREEGFQGWLSERYGETVYGENILKGLGSVEDHTASLLRIELGIDSRSDLLENEEARDRFRTLIQEYRGETRDG